VKKLSEFAIKYPVTITMIVLGVILLGYLSYDKLGVDLFPDLNNPSLFIDMEAGEKPPEEIESQYVDKLEALAIRQSDVIQVSSITKVGVTRISVKYAWNKDMDDAYLDLQKAITSYSQNKDDIDDISISQHDPNASSVMTLCLSSKNNKDMNDLRKVAENYIRNELIRLNGIAEVSITGDQEREVLIETNQNLLDAYGLTMSTISTKINNFNSSISGGSIEENGMKYVVKGVSLLTNTEDFENILVGYKVSDETDSIETPVFLKNLAKVSLHNKDPENIVRLNGTRCLGLSVYKETKYNTVKAVDEVDEALKDIRKALPGYDLTLVNNQGLFIKNSIKEVENSTLLGILLAVVVLFFFLKRFGSTIIISLAIPISIIATFNLMYFGGLSLNIMTLGGLALGAGMLVDNAIVVMENIFRNHENGLSVRDAAITGTSQVGGAITSSTLTTIVVFLPIVYLHGAAGELFKDQAWTVTFSLLSSLLVAIFFIPMLFHTIYKNKTKIESRSVQVKGYGNFLKKVLKKKWLVIIFTLMLMGVSAFMVPYIGTEFMPKTETGKFMVTVRMPEGTRLERTSSAVSNLEGLIKQVLRTNIETMYTRIGPSDDDATNDFLDGDNTAEIEIHLNKEHELSSSSAIQIINNTIGKIPGIEIGYTQGETALSSILGTDQSPLVVEIKGEELDELESLAGKVKNKIENLHGIYNAESAMEGGSPEVEVQVDRMRAGMYDVSVSTIVSQIESQLQGETVGQVKREGEMEDITLKLPDKTLADLNDLRIVSGGQEFHVDELANIITGTAPKQIYRRDQTRIAKVTAQLDKDVPLDQAVKEIRKAIAPIALPNDYKINISGEEEQREDSMSSLGFALILSIVLVYMVMASQFESLLHPFTILLTIPLAAVGSIITFFLLGRSFNIMAFIGVIMLVGIAVNDSILLIDRILQLRKEGLPRMESIVQAGQQRIRPIIMTSVTTILALLPLTIGFGESASLRSPMALAVIGGMITSTLLTLIVIPCVYELFEEAKDKISK